MKTRNLGNTGLKVSELCLGAMTFGEADDKTFMHQVGASEATSFRMIDRSLDAGVNFIDTADVYGQDGLSGRVIGNWFEQSKRRNDVVIATKFRFTMGQGPNASGASRYRIVKTVEESLRRLKTDCIDLYQILKQNITTPEEEALRELDDLVSAGKVLYIGCSNYAAYRLVDSLWISEVKRFAKFATLQAEYSLVVRELEREHVPLCRKFGLGILPWSPLAGGFLSGKYKKEEKPPEGSRLERWQQRWGRHDNERGWRTLDAVRDVAQELNATPAAVSLAWLLAQDCLTSVISGARDVAQVEANIKATDITLSADQLKRLDKASRLELGYPYDFMRSIQGRW